MVPCAIEETSALRSDASVDVEDEVDGVAGKIIEKKCEITCEVRFTISLLAYRKRSLLTAQLSERNSLYLHQWRYP